MSDNLRSNRQEAVVTEQRPETDTQTTDSADDRVHDAAQQISVIVDGEPVDVESGTSVGELRDRAGVSEESVLTYRSEGGIEALTDDEVVSDVVEEGTALWAQPLSDGEVFGSS